MAAQPVSVRPEVTVADSERALSRSACFRGWLACLAVVLILYLLTVAPGPLWQDSGTAQLRVLQHQLTSGEGLVLDHPLYYLIAMGFQWLPLDSSALKTNLVSAVFGAITVANVWLLLRLLRCTPWAAALGAASLAVAHTFWLHAAIAEVYTVSTAILSGELLAAAMWVRSRRAGWLVLLFALNGLGISNHMLHLLNVPVWGLLLLVAIGRRPRSWPLLPLAGVAWLAGMAVYLWLIGQELERGTAPREVLRLALFGQRHEGDVLNVHVGVRLLRNSVMYLGLNFPTPAALLILVGGWAAWRRVDRVFIGALLGLTVIHLLWAVRYDVPDQYTFFLPAIVLLAVWLGLGAEAVLARWPRAWVAVGLAGLVVLPVAVYAALPAVARRAGLKLGLSRTVPYRDPYSFFLQPWKTGYDGAERFAREVDARLQPGDALMADSTTARPIHYLMLTGQWQTEPIKLFPPLPPPYRELHPEPADLADELARGRVFVVTPKYSYAPRWLAEGYEYEFDGLLYHPVRPIAQERPTEARAETQP